MASIINGNSKKAITSFHAKETLDTKDKSPDTQASGPHVESISTQSSANMKPSVDLLPDIAPRPEPIDVALNVSHGTGPVRTDEVPLVNTTPNESGDIVVNRQFQTKPYETSTLKNTKALDTLANIAAGEESVEKIEAAPAAALDQVSRVRSRHPYWRGRKGQKKRHDTDVSTSENAIAENIQDVTDSVTTEAHVHGNKHASVVQGVIPAERSVQILARIDGVKLVDSLPVNILTSNRALRMEPVVLPRLLESLQNPTNHVSSESHKIPPQPSKTAKDFAKDIPKMTKDLKRVTEKMQQLSVEASASKPSIKKAEIKENPTNFMVLKTSYPEPTATQSLPTTPADTLTFEEWKQLPPAKRYAPLTHKEKLAIQTMEIIPQTFLASSSSQHTTTQVADLVSPRQLPLIDRMAFTFARVMALARAEADNGHFDWSPRKGPKNNSSLDSHDVMSRAQVEAFVTGMQEVKDPDRRGLVVMRRYWRIIGGLESGDGIGGVVAACSKEEKYLGRPSFRLRAKKGGMDAVLVCEVEVDREGVMTGREWDEVE